MMAGEDKLEVAGASGIERPKRMHHAYKRPLRLCCMISLTSLYLHIASSISFSDVMLLTGTACMISAIAAVTLE